MNILFLMTDHTQGRLLDPAHPCQLPNLTRVMDRGIRFQNAYTSNAICSPARAGVMTGLLPHNHGVLTVTHVVDNDQCCLRLDKPHWAQRLVDAGYRTGYFGKWHVERTNQLEDFGWQVNGVAGGEIYKAKVAEVVQDREWKWHIQKELTEPPGYNVGKLYGVHNIPPEERKMGVICSCALDFLDDVMGKDEPWCCFVSVPEPHDPFMVGKDAFNLYDVDSIELPPNLHDELAGRPGIYRKAARVWQHMTDREHREAAACYWALNTEIDQQFGRVLKTIEDAGELDNTLIVMTTDHGELLGAHGMYCKNFSGSEEIYNIPLIVAGPNVAEGVVSHARVGSHELGPTILDHVDAPPIDAPDSQSFAALLPDPAAGEDQFQQGYAEYFGGRMILTQRIVYDGPWKFVFNGFDFDELYNLEDDPYEMTNLAEAPEHQEVLQHMCALMWKYVDRTDDRSLKNSHYPILRVAPFGPNIEDPGLPGRKSVL